MKNINKILTELGVEIPEDKTADFEKVFNENYKTVTEVNNLNIKLTNLQTKYDTDIASRDKDLESLKTDLSKAGEDTAKLAEVTKQLEKLQGDYTAQKDSYSKELAKQQYEFLVREAANEIKFSSNSAKKAFTQDIMNKGLNVEDGKLMGFDDYVKAYKETDADAFAKEEPSVPNNSTSKPHFADKANPNPDPQPETKEVPALW